jgi:hypothetical protein
MADISISLNNIRNTKEVLIEGIGAFTVRKLGAGEELDLSSKMRRLGVILNELQAIDFTKHDPNTEEGIKELDKIRKRATKLSDEVSEIQKFELSVYKRAFESHNKPEDVDTLLDQLSIEDRSNLFKQIFETKIIESPEESEQEDEI